MVTLSGDHASFAKLRGIPSPFAQRATATSVDNLGTTPETAPALRAGSAATALLPTLKGTAPTERRSLTEVTGWPGGVVAKKETKQYHPWFHFLMLLLYFKKHI